VKRLNEFNISLLGKWVWRVLDERESIWNVVLRAKYGEVGAGAVWRRSWIDLVACFESNSNEGVTYRS
jgi:hypothetical protein